MNLERLLVPSHQLLVVIQKDNFKNLIINPIIKARDRDKIAKK